MGMGRKRIVMFSKRIKLIALLLFFLGTIFVPCLPVKLRAEEELLVQDLAKRYLVLMPYIR